MSSPKPAPVLLTLSVLLVVPLVAAVAEPTIPGDLNPVSPGASVAPLVAPGGADAAARAMVSELPRATFVNDRDGDKLFDTLEAEYVAAAVQGADPALRTIVVFRHDVSTAAGIAAVRTVVPSIDIRHDFDVIPGIAATVTKAEATSIAGLDEVRQVQWSHPGTLELDGSRTYTGADVAVAEYGFDGDRDGDPDNFTAADVTVLISDTGFDSEHVDLPPRKFIAVLDAGENTTDAPWDSGTHGTHVASIVGGLGIGDAKYRGVAPGASFIGSRISGPCDGGTPFFSITGTCPDAHALAIETLDWAVANKAYYGIDITTISFGFGIATDGTDALELAMDKAWDAGIVNFKSTGNSGPNPSTMTVPAAARGIIATGAMRAPHGPPGEPDAGFYLASFSSRGPTTDGRVKPDIAAPGVSVMAADAGTGDGYVAKSGTSMASPFAAGTAALVLDANPDLTPDEVRQVLFESARDWGLEGADNEYGNGRIDVLRAVELAHFMANESFSRTATPPMVPGHQSFEATLDGTGFGGGTFEVEDAGLPLAATVIAQTTSTDGALWLLNAQIVGPEGQRTDVAHVQTLAKTPSRQVTLWIQPTEEGTHELQVIGEPGTRLSVDISAGVPLQELIELVPEGGSGPEGVDVEEEPVPAPFAIWVTALAAAAVGVRRHRRG